MSSVLNVFQELVRIDSPSGHEEQICSWITNWAVKNGWSYVADGIGNLIVTKQAATMLPFFLCAHMDTVQPGEGVQPVLKNNSIYSEGNTILGADNKASMAAIVSAVEAWHEASDVGFQLLFTVKEEIGGGAEALDQSHLQTKVGYIFDYAEPLGTIIVAAPYITNFKITLTGKASHACFPDEGWSVLPAITDLLMNIPVGKQTVGDSYINVGTVCTGTGSNIVPGSAVINGEIRAFKKSHFNLHLSLVRGLAMACANQQISVTFETSGYCAGYSHKAANPAVTELKKILSEAELSPVLKKSYSISDANSLNEMGFTVITSSDGVRQPHTTDEHIAVSDLEKLESIILELIKSAAREAA